MIKSCVKTLLTSGLLLSVAASFALPLPKNIIGFSSKQGQQLLLQSNNKAAYWRLAPYFITERGLSWCAIAADVMALNALGIKKPLTPEHAPYRIFTQDTFFNNAKAIDVIPPARVFAGGVTLAQDKKLLEAHGVNVKMVYADQSSADDFRQAAIDAIGSKNKVILINYCRNVIGQTGCGHFSPLAAYNKKADRFLIMDVARYKYPPAWVKANELYKAISVGKDTTSHLHRGYLIVSK